MPQQIAEPTVSNLIEEKTHFFSDGLKLDASFYWPKDEFEQGGASDKPIFVMCSGYTGLNAIHPARFSRFLTGFGYTCFGFDYRGFEKSEGERGRVILEQQVSDIVHAVSYMSGQLKLAGRPIILMGWGMGGGLVLEAARLTPNLKAVIAINGFYDAQRVQVALRGEQKWQEFQRWLHSERVQAACTGNISDFDSFDIYPLDRVSEEYVNNVLRRTPGYNEGTRARLDFADSLLNFAPERRLQHLRNTPVLIAHGDKNALHPPVEAKSLYEAYPGPKTLHWIPDAGHTEFMLDENPTFQNLVKKINDWVENDCK